MQSSQSMRDVAIVGPLVAGGLLLLMTGGAAAQPSIEAITASYSQARLSQNNPPSISADGRYVAFEMMLVPEGQGGQSAIYVHDRLTELTLDSIDSSGQQVEYGLHPSLSGDGRFLSFTTHELQPRAQSVYVRDRMTRQSRRIRHVPGAFRSSTPASAHRAPSSGNRPAMITSQ
jgi:hypothetical protein